MHRPFLAALVLSALASWLAGPAHDPEERIQALDRRIRANPTHAALYLERGEVHRQLRNFRAAVSDFERATRLDGRLHTAHFLRAITLLQDGHPGPALAASDMFLALQPRHGAGLLTRARALARLRRHEQAATEYDAALPLLSPRRPQHYLERARAWADAGRIDRALAGLDEAYAELGSIVSLAQLAVELAPERGGPEAAFRHLGDRPRAPPDLPLPLATERTHVASATRTVLVPEGAVWRYLDDGSDQGTAWSAPSFDDSTWASGPAQLGYGDGDEATVVSFGPNSEAKFFTTYFRHTFQVPNPAQVQRLRMRLLRDDGAMVYLNGTELARSNMPGGAIGYTTPAAATISSTAESIFDPFSVDPALLQPGTNVFAVEVHQRSSSSSDISFDLELVASDGPALVVRGPYLQSGTQTSAVLRWSTDIAVPSAVWIGTAPGYLSLAASAPTPTTVHEVQVTGLAPGELSFYGVGDGQTILAGDDADHRFTTHPLPSTTDPTRVWVIGDSGTANHEAKAVRDAYFAYAGGSDTDVWLMLGDNAYEDGAEGEYQVAVFEMFSELLRNTFLWPTIGNHDVLSAVSATESGVYYDMFTLPRQAEAGGLASGTEAYYSFDYADIHFICLNSHDIDRGAAGAMMAWLAADLAATTEKWTIAYWHHPPYSKGSHDSDVIEDSGGRMKDMREIALPILEAAGVDLVLCGHSHSYERSYLLDGHYGKSTELTPAMILDLGNGNEASDGAYAKPTAGMAPHEGAIYAVAGCSGQTESGPLNHPAMYVSLVTLGSLVLDIDGDRLDGRFLDHLGNVLDAFTILKGVPRTLTRVEPRISETQGGVQDLRIDVGPSGAGLAYVIAGSLGTEPGFLLGSVQVPLNADPYFSFTLTLANSAVYQGTFGFLDAAGLASAAIHLPPLNDPAFVGLELYHAAILFDSLNWISATNTVKLILDP